jgi:hypothetical protein
LLLLVKNLPAAVAAATTAAVVRSSYNDRELLRADGVWFRAKLDGSQ